MITVLLVDDEQMVCAHLRTILSAAAGISVIGEAYDGADAVEQAIRLRPHVALVDLRMPGVDGVTAIGRLTQLGLPTKAVALTAFDADDLVLAALHAGATGFLLKSTEPEELANLVRAAAGGSTVLSPAATARLLGNSGRAKDERTAARRRLAALTTREAEVLVELSSGRSNGEIAGRLHVSEATVKGHVSRILDKLGCTNRTQAGLLAHAAGHTS